MAPNGPPEIAPLSLQLCIQITLGSTDQPWRVAPFLRLEAVLCAFKYVASITNPATAAFLGKDQFNLFNLLLGAPK